MASEGPMDAKRAIEAVLFSVGDKISTREIARIVGCDERKCLDHLSELVQEYRMRESPIIIINEGSSWKMTVREKYIGVVREVMPETELTRSVMETLAVIAWKSPVLQSEVVDIRSTKAYEHIRLLEERGFINKERSGRSYMLTLTRKFFDYFDLTGDKEMKELFEELTSEYGSIRGLVAVFNRPKKEEQDEPVGRKDIEDASDSTEGTAGAQPDGPGALEGPETASEVGSPAEESREETESDKEVE